MADGSVRREKANGLGQGQAKGSSASPWAPGQPPQARPATSGQVLHPEGQPKSHHTPGRISGHLFSHHPFVPRAPQAMGSRCRAHPWSMAKARRPLDLGSLLGKCAPPGPNAPASAFAQLGFSSRLPAPPTPFGGLCGVTQLAPHTSAIQEGRWPLSCSSVAGSPAKGQLGKGPLGKRAQLSRAGS